MTAYVDLPFKLGDDTEVDFRLIDLGGGVYGTLQALANDAGAVLIGQQAKTGSLPVIPASDWPLLGSGLATPSDSFTRPANTTPYTSGDLIADNVTAGSVVPLNFVGAARFNLGAGKITRASITKSAVSLTNAQFRLHLYTANPTGLVNGDNGAWSTNLAGYIGAMGVTVDRAFVDGSYGDGVPFNLEPIRFKLASGSSLKGLLEARAAYTPASGEVFTVTLEVEQT